MINSILSFSHDRHLPYSTYNWRNSICRGMNDLNTLRTQEMLHILIIWLRDHRDSGSLLPCPKPSEPEAVNNAPPHPTPSAQPCHLSSCLHHPSLFLSFSVSIRRLRGFGRWNDRQYSTSELSHMSPTRQKTRGTWDGLTPDLVLPFGGD